MVSGVAVTDVAVQAVLTFSMTTDVPVEPAFICLCCRRSTAAYIYMQIYIYTETHIYITHAFLHLSLAMFTLLRFLNVALKKNF